MIIQFPIHVLFQGGPYSPFSYRHYVLQFLTHHNNNTKYNTNNKDNEHWYEHAKKPVETSHKFEVKILWNQQVQTGRIISNN